MQSASFAVMLSVTLVVVDMVLVADTVVLEPVVVVAVVVVAVVVVLFKHRSNVVPHVRVVEFSYEIQTPLLLIQGPDVPKLHRSPHVNGSLVGAAVGDLISDGDVLLKNSPLHLYVSSGHVRFSGCLYATQTDEPPNTMHGPAVS